MPNRPELGRQLQPVLSTGHRTQNMLSELKDLLPGKNPSRAALPPNTWPSKLTCLAARHDSPWHVVSCNVPVIIMTE